MPRQSKNQTSAPAAAETPVVAEPVVAAPPAAEAPVEKKARAPRKKAAAETPATETTPVAEPAPVAEAAPADTPSDATPAERTRAVHTRESLMTGFAELLSSLEQQSTQLREGSDKATNNVRFLRAVSKRVRDLQTTAGRLLRQKQPSQRKNNNSGFLKPVKISPEMAKFTGLDPNSLHSRVDVTKFICKYVADKNLQNPTDRRQINADPSLAKLLSYDAKKSDKPLTYYHMQSLLKNHFTKSA